MSSILNEPNIISYIWGVVNVFATYYGEPISIGLIIVYCIFKKANT